MLTLTAKHRFPFRWKHAAFSAKSVGWMALTMSILAGSTYNSFAKTLALSLSPWSLFFVSELLTALFVLFFFGAMPTIRAFFRLPRSSYLPLLVVGLTSGTLAPLLLFTGLSTTTAVNGSLFGNTEMVFLILLAVVVLGEKFTPTHTLSVCMIVAGMIVIALHGFNDGLAFAPGDIFLILASATFAVGSIVFRKFLHHTEPHLVLLVRSAVAISCFFLFSPFLNHTLMQEIVSLPLMAIPVLCGFAFVSRFLNVFGFYASIERLPVTTVSLASNMSIVTSTLFAHVYLGESVLPYHLAGGGFILLGMILLDSAGTHSSEKHLERHLKQRHGHR